MIWHLPLEEYPTRYTADWTRQFESKFQERGLNFITLKGSIDEKVRTEDDPLDAVGTSLWKTIQMEKIERAVGEGAVKDGDWIFFADIWFPGIQNLMYLRDMLGIKFKIAGVLHAGCYDRHDFTYRRGMSPWGLPFEKSVLEGADEIFVATNFHKELVEKTHDECPKVKVTGIPFYAEELEKFNSPKDERLVLFPHRLADEKHPELFDELSRLLGDKYVCVKTMQVCQTRQEYFDLLGKASYVVSFAEQETFGYSMLEALALGANVYVPDALSYKETMPENARYDCLLENAPKVLAKKILQKESTANPSYASKWSDAIYKMLYIMEDKN